ncbi:uncharacterized protein LOC130692880 isoform X2 [Daphnia carinata]|uniref:uncharacterized protein LOC130692880 isoform X2 n=1 Tax=Daphnia carinata TaxID=120202 RepID=UPI002868BE70|nr:uncharacterized protein LOC130692880 isoform X2 [Daphnia carinata]
MGVLLHCPHSDTGHLSAGPVLCSWFGFCFQQPTVMYRMRTTMRATHQRQAEWFVLLALSAVLISVTASATRLENATLSLLDQGPKVNEELFSKPKANEKRTNSEFSIRSTASSVFDDLCRLHSNLLDAPLTFEQNQMDGGTHSAAINILHEIFDPSFGLVPYVPYTVQITLDGYEGSYLYALQANVGKLTQTSPQATASRMCDPLSDNSVPQLLQLTSVFNNISWIFKSTPKVETAVTFRILGYSTVTRKIFSLAVLNHTVIPGCYLKLHSSRGIVSSSYFPPQFESTTYGVDHSSSPTWECLLLLNVPGGSSAELTLRKLKLHRPHSRECHEDSQLQLATSTSWGPRQMVDGKQAHNSQQPSWSNLAEVHRWQVARTFCGKIQDYSKSLRTWQTFQPWVLIRYTSNQRNRHHIRGSNGASNSFFVFKFNILEPCLNVLLTEPSKTIELSDSDLVANPQECTFRIHVPYGYQIKLSVRLHDDDSRIPHENDLVKKDAVGDEELSYNSLLLQSGKCQIAVQIEDVTGHRAQCLNDHHPSASFSSLANFLKFQAVVLRPMNQGGEEAKPSSNTSYGETRSTHSALRLRVHYTTEADPRLTDGCGEGVLVDEQTCVWLHSEPLTWHEAEEKCSQLAPNGHLVAITNSEIEQVVDTLITKSVDYEPEKSYWIGGSDQKQETVFEWSSGATFNYTKWFPGWPVYQLYNAQPSDDGISNQDCVEIRQSFGQPGQSESLASGFYWNDRDCSVGNPFVCQKPRHNDDSNAVTFGEFKDVMNCNRTEELNRLRTSTVVQSPFFPRPYPNTVTCIVDLSAPPGFKIVLNFDFFDLEEEEDCNYDVLELQNLDQLSIFGERKDARTTPWRRCGNWNSRLKLLQWKSNGNQARIKFSSDSSYNSNGFQLRASIERADLNCPEVGSIFHHGRCYLIAPYPEISWFEANEMCRSMQAGLVLSDSNGEEIRFLLDQINSNEQLNSTAFYWIGQSNRFQLSIPLWVGAVQKCPSIRAWPQLTNATVNLEPCGSPGGYICEILVKNDRGIVFNSSVESREGEVKSPNYPAPYGEGNHFRLHIKAPNSSSTSERLVVRFKQIDIEFQENCLYDYLGLQSKENGPMQKICGHYTSNLERLDYVSETSEIWITFHSDFSISGDGFHAVWSTMPLPGCPLQIMEKPEGEFFSPYYPFFLLPNLNCTLHIIAPEGARVWIKFHTFDMDFRNERQQFSCRDEYVRLDWGSSNSIQLCGSYNLSRDALQWISDGNELKVQLITRNGKRGRGFHASYRFMPIPTILADTLFLGNEDELELVPFNYPHPPPSQLRQRITLMTRHGSYLRHQAPSWMTPCDSSFRPTVTAMVVLRDAYNNNTEIKLCYTNETIGSTTEFESSFYDTKFHTLTIEYVHVGINWSGVLGRVKSLQDSTYAEKVSALPDHSPVNSCDPHPCQGESVCTAVDDQYYCQCEDNWRGIFCSLTLCQLPSSCHHGTCVTVNETQRCNCDPGFTGYLCESRLAPCDLDPCGDRGKCVPSADGFICQCAPWWQGPRCETRWLHLPYKPLSQRMLEEPFWLGLMTIAIVLIIIAIVWCAKRHFAEKFERFVNDELERGKLVEPAMLDWSRGRHNCHQINMEANAISRPVSPQTGLSVPATEATGSQRNFLGWPGFRKPSLLSITSLISPSNSHTSVTGNGGTNGGNSRRISACSRGPRSGRTFSLDDLFRLPKRSPSPSKRGSDNDVASQRRDIERQQILQRLIASQIPNSHPGYNTSDTGEAIMMTQLSLQSPSSFLNTIHDHTTDASMMDTAIAAQLQLQLDLKAEKKVTFARMMEMVKNDMTSSENDTSASEEPSKYIEVVDESTASNPRNAHNKRKQRSWNSRHFWRSNNSNSMTQGSANDQDIQDNFPLTDQTPSNETVNGVGISKSNRHLRLPSRNVVTGSRQASSTESLLNIIRNFSAANHRTPSTPSSPQMSDYELSSSFPTPLSTPGTPAGSLEVIPPTSNAVDSTSIQVAVIDASAMSHRNSRLGTTNFTSPHITLEIPTMNYGQFLSPIHEVPTPLPSPAHTPIPSTRRAERCGSSDSPVSSGSSAAIDQRRSLLQQRWHRDGCNEKHGIGTSVPSIVEKVTSSREIPEKKSISIVVPSNIQILVESDSAQPSPISSTANSPLPSPAKTKPPRLNILNSNFARFEAFEMSTDTNEIAPVPPVTVPLLCVSEASPENTDFDPLPKKCQNTKSQCTSVLDWEHVSLGSPPLRRLPVDAMVTDRSINDKSIGIRRNFKDTLDKSSSLDLPHPPPIITITTNFSEVESDSDAGMLGKGGTSNQKMCYLSPFVCYGESRPDIATSESNLSSSGYSSMASPGISPACSSKTLCIWKEEEDMVTFSRTHGGRRDRRLFHRALLSPSLESSSPPLDSPPETPSAVLRSLHRSNVNRLIYPQDSETADDPIANLFVAPAADEPSPACESHDEGIDVFHVCGKTADKSDQDSLLDSKFLSLIQVHKSISLDSKLVGQRRNNLKGDSLDTKLLSLQPGGMPPIVLQSLQLPEPSSLWTCSGNFGSTDETRVKVSPVSSRSESPLSDVRSAGLGRFSTKFYGMSRIDMLHTDSDGLYDYPSSETILPPSSIHRRHTRKCDRRRERKSSLKSSRIDHHRDSLALVAKRSFLDPCIDRGAGRLVSTKRKSRVRAQSNIDFCATSSSNESLSSVNKRLPHKKGPQIINLRRGSSPLCDVILTIQAASSLDELHSEVGEEKQENETISSSTSIELRAFRLPTRSRPNTAFRFPERRRQDSICRRREQPPLLRNCRGSRRACSTAEGALCLKGISSTESSYTESDACDSNESLANFGEIEDTVDSPPN